MSSFSFSKDISVPESLSPQLNDLFQKFWTNSFTLFLNIRSPYVSANYCLQLIRDLIAIVSQEPLCPALLLALDVVIQRSMYELSDKILYDENLSSQKNSDPFSSPGSPLGSFSSLTTSSTFSSTFSPSTPSFSASSSLSSNKSTDLIQSCISLISSFILPFYTKSQQELIQFLLLDPIIQNNDKFKQEIKSNDLIGQKISIINRQLQELFSWTCLCYHGEIPLTFISDSNTDSTSNDFNLFNNNAANYQQEEINNNMNKKNNNKKYFFNLNEKNNFLNKFDEKIYDTLLQSNQYSSDFSTSTYNPQLSSASNSIPPFSSENKNGMDQYGKLIQSFISNQLPNIQQIHYEPIGSNMSGILNSNVSKKSYDYSFFLQEKLENNLKKDGNLHKKDLNASLYVLSKDLYLAKGNNNNFNTLKQEFSYKSNFYTQTVSNYLLRKQIFMNLQQLFGIEFYSDDAIKHLEACLKDFNSLCKNFSTFLLSFKSTLTKYNKILSSNNYNLLINLVDFQMYFNYLHQIGENFILSINNLKKNKNINNKMMISNVKNYLNILNDFSFNIKKKDNYNLIRKSAKLIEKSLKFSFSSVKVSSTRSGLIHLFFSLNPKSAGTNSNNNQNSIVKKFLDVSPNSASFSIFLNSELPLHSHWLIENYLINDKTNKVKIFLLLIKNFVKGNEISNQNDGFLSLYGWYILALHFLLRFQFIQYLPSPYYLTNNSIPYSSSCMCNQCSQYSLLKDSSSTLNISRSVYDAFCKHYISHVNPTEVKLSQDKLNNISYLQLLDLFFRYYVEYFDTFNSVVSISLPIPSSPLSHGNILSYELNPSFTPPSKQNWMHTSVLWRLSVEDPIAPIYSDFPYDIGTTMSRLGQLITFKVLRRGLFSLRTIVSILNSSIPPENIQIEKEDRGTHCFNAALDSFKKLFHSKDLIKLARGSDYKGSGSISNTDLSSIGSINHNELSPRQSYISVNSFLTFEDYINYNPPISQEDLTNILSLNKNAYQIYLSNLSSEQNLSTSIPSPPLTIPSSSNSVSTSNTSVESSSTSISSHFSSSFSSSSNSITFSPSSNSLLLQSFPPNIILNPNGEYTNNNFANSSNSSNFHHAYLNKNYQQSGYNINSHSTPSIASNATSKSLDTSLNHNLNSTFFNKNSNDLSFSSSSIPNSSFHYSHNLSRPPSHNYPNNSLNSSILVSSHNNYPSQLNNNNSTYHNNYNYNNDPNYYQNLPHNMNPSSYISTSSSISSNTLSSTIHPNTTSSTTHSTSSSLSNISTSPPIISSQYLTNNNYYNTPSNYSQNKQGNYSQNISYSNYSTVSQNNNNHYNSHSHSYSPSSPPSNSALNYPYMNHSQHFPHSYHYFEKEIETNKNYNFASNSASFLNQSFFPCNSSSSISLSQSTSASLSSSSTSTFYSPSSFSSSISSPSSSFYSAFGSRKDNNI